MRQMHLVGSVPLASTEEVLRDVADTVGPFLRRMPDGETGARLTWIDRIRKKLDSNPAFDPSRQLDHYGRPGKLRLAPGKRASDIDLGDLGYAAAALDSFKVFDALQAEGVIAPGVRFQVNLPTPLAFVAAHIDPDLQRDAEPLFERTMLRELATVVEAIDPSRLAIQWDVAIEFAILYARLPIWFGADEDEIVRRLAHISAAVPLAAELGFHFCFGDAGHKHFVEPESLAPLVSMANKVSAAVAHPISWIHMPVPRDRNDDAYFAPIETYRSDATLFLGLIHLTDGFDGTQRRVAAAKRHHAAFGVGTECGFGRRPPETVRALLDLHRQVCEAL